MKKNRLPLKVVLLVVLMVIIETSADILMKKSILNTGTVITGFSNISHFIILNLQSALMWIGIILYLSTFIIWITALHKAELSIVYPVSSVGYIIVPLMAIIFLSESIPFERWLGFVSIIGGIFFVSRNNIKEGPRPC